MKRVVVLGSTGSIGTSCLEVIASHPDRLQLIGASAHRNWKRLADQTRRFKPPCVVVSDVGLRESVDRAAFHPSTKLHFGPQALEELVAGEAVDVVVAAIVGSAGLRGTWAALESGKTVAIANKETLVVAGPLVTQLAARRGAKLLPVDSEHSAIFQALECGRPREVQRLILTTSGGPFRGWTRQRLEGVTPEMALAHPTWQMGPKITVDSATMMNKALEVIEARWLFDVDVDRIEVVVHPQSIVHSGVEFVDGALMVQMAPPDMKLPIQYALSWPERWEGVTPRMDFSQVQQLEFAPPDTEAFPALVLGYEVARRGGTAGAVLNAANEVAVARFLQGGLRFVEIAQLCREIVEHHEFDAHPSLDALQAADRWAREEAQRWKS